MFTRCINIAGSIPDAPKSCDFLGETLRNVGTPWSSAHELGLDAPPQLLPVRNEEPEAVGLGSSCEGHDSAHAIP